MNPATRLEKFLINRGLLEIFKHNIEKCLNKEIRIDSFETLVKSKIYTGFIIYAFDWCDTPEGHDYWWKIHNEWKNCVTNNLL